MRCTSSNPSFFTEQGSASYRSSKIMLNLSHKQFACGWYGVVCHIYIPESPTLFISRPELALRMVILDRGRLLTKKLADQGYTLEKLKIYFQNFCGRYNHLLQHYNTPLSTLLMCVTYTRFGLATWLDSTVGAWPHKVKFTLPGHLFTRDIYSRLCYVYGLMVSINGWQTVISSFRENIITTTSLILTHKSEDWLQLQCKRLTIYQTDMVYRTWFHKTLSLVRLSKYRTWDLPDMDQLCYWCCIVIIIQSQPCLYWHRFNFISGEIQRKTPSIHSINTLILSTRYMYIIK